ncbi:MAG: 3-deoxy-7-phosphoheptulonate synthase class II [Planctomycetota bacterium]
MPSLDWSPRSWRERPVTQMPNYPDAHALSSALEELGALPPLVTSWEVESLREQLAEAARGDRFILQGGDCSENFDECRSETIAGKLKILLQMSLVLVHGNQKRVTRIGRFAGQYAKPRSADTETKDGVTLPTYRGDLVNRIGFTEAERIPDPNLLLRGYERAALTLNFIRSLIDGGFADLHHPEYWDLSFVSHSERRAQYQNIVDSIAQSIHFLEAIHGARIHEVGRVDFFTSHEGLHLHYEEAQTRQVPRREGWYNLSTHFPWIGERTRDLSGAHIEFFRGLVNPIGVKIGPTIAADELVELVRTLNPQNDPGRLTLIHRFGAKKIESCLPGLVEAIEREKLSVVWCCDPMHGNTEVVEGGYKTRDFSNILSELEQAFDIHAKKGSYLGGVHFELTGENVTECTGGARGLTPADLAKAYKTQVDPRLNYEQSLEMALRIGERMSQA